MKFIYKNSFLRKFDRYISKEKLAIIQADEKIRSYCSTQRSPYGLRIKKLYDNGKEKTFEARASDKIRIIWVKGKDVVSFVFLGTHDEIRRYLKNLIK